jgi:hypothetical protein
MPPKFGKPVFNRDEPNLAPPPPDPPFVQFWNSVERDRLGVRAQDPDGHNIGPNIAKRGALGLNWYPVDRFKQTLVGTLEGYQFFDGTGDEADWNLFINPSPAFRFIRDDVLPNADPGELHRSNTGEALVEAEITPDEALFSNPFFPRVGASPLVGRTIGVYGPWVQEEAHGFRPEIHPCELLWWRDVNGSGANQVRTYHLLVVQDDSNRFDRSENFSGKIARPWSAFPRRADFWIAVRVPVGGRRQLVIEQLFVRNVQLATGEDAPVRLTHMVSGASVEVERRQFPPRHVRVRFESFTATADGQEVLGFVRLTSVVGSGDRGQEGFLVLKVTDMP